MKTLKFEIITGINERYGKVNENTNNLKSVSELWQKIAEKIYKNRGVYISAVINECKTVYSVRWGCPIGGESTLRITGVANKEFVSDFDLWKQCVLEITSILKNELNQSTMTCEFSKVELHYFKANKNL